ncbi:hypothetical protein OF83DRAFT_297966 [Amylostereum chailletii]|nr:hypothetical protein OF83DRAFT_297966 [Amylostereum chailletii]
MTRWMEMGIGHGHVPIPSWERTRMRRRSAEAGRVYPSAVLLPIGRHHPIALGGDTARARGPVTCDLARQRQSCEGHVEAKNIGIMTDISSWQVPSLSMGMNPLGWVPTLVSRLSPLVPPIRARARFPPAAFALRLLPTSIDRGRCLRTPPTRAVAGDRKRQNALSRSEDEASASPSMMRPGDGRGPSPPSRPPSSEGMIAAALKLEGSHLVCAHERNGFGGAASTSLLGTGTGGSWAGRCGLLAGEEISMNGVVHERNVNGACYERAQAKGGRGPGTSSS